MSFRFTLKAATQAAHDGVDAAFSTCDLTTKAGLSRFLKAQYTGLEFARQVGDDTLKYVAAQEICALKSDIMLLSDSLPLVSAIEKDKPHSLGVAYVVAGSYFGGQILQNRWKKSSDINVLAAKDFMTSSHRKALWPYVLSALASLNASEHKAVIAAANTTFDIYKNGLN